jgi:hypothetical protein
MKPNIAHTYRRLPPEVQEALSSLWQALSPVVQALSASLRRAMANRRGTTLGMAFRHISVVGLNRTELSFDNTSSSIFGENWYDMIDDVTRRHMALLFFAPRDFTGEPINPYLLLAGDDTTQGEDTEAAENALLQAQTFIGTIPLLDLCRMPPAEPNVVNMIVAADVLFHWDIKDNYVLPTSPTSWIRDVQQVLKSYPRTTQATLYTQWDAELLPTQERLAVRPLRDLPLTNQVWLNRPTVQQAYGNHLLALGMVLAGLVGAYVWWSQAGISHVTDQLRAVEQQIPASAKFGDFQRAVNEQEKMMLQRELFFFTVKDTARALSTAAFKTATFEVRNPQVQDPPKQLLVTVEAAKDSYKGWLEEEPIAKKILLNSALMSAIRKPPGTTFKLEGLVQLDKLWPAYKQLATQRASQAQKRSTP